MVSEVCSMALRVQGDLEERQLDLEDSILVLNIIST